MRHHAKKKSVLVVLFLMIFLTACGGNKDLAKEACTVLSGAWNNEKIANDMYSDPSLKDEYLKAEALFAKLSDKESGSKDGYDKVFKAYSVSIKQWANGENYGSIDLSDATYFCGPSYKFITRDYPSIVDDKYYIEDYLGVPISRSVSESSAAPFDEPFNWSPIIVIALLICYLFAAYWIGLIARKSGRSFIPWLLLGLAVLPVACILVLSLKPEDKKSSQLKKCPFCAESIQQEAKFCRYCSKEIS